MVPDFMASFCQHVHVQMYTLLRKDGLQLLIANLLNVICVARDWVSNIPYSETCHILSS